jgi:hypothetical protein
MSFKSRFIMFCLGPAAVVSAMACLAAPRDRVSPSVATRHLPPWMVQIAGGGQPGWIPGPSAYSETIGCISGVVQNGAAVSLAYWGTNDLTRPRVQEQYWLGILMFGMGYPCVSPYGHLELLLPPHTALAISPQAPLECSTVDAAGNRTIWTGNADMCRIDANGYYGHSINPTSGGWQLSAGMMVELWVPVVSSEPLRGTLGNDFAYVPFVYIDGICSGGPSCWSVAQQGVVVAGDGNDRIFRSDFQ